MRMGTSEIVLLVLLFVVVFGAKKIPQFAEGLGKGIRNFKKAVSGDERAEATPARTAEPARLAWSEPAPAAASRAHAEVEAR